MDNMIKGMNHLRLYFGFLDAARNALNDEQMGRLLVALVDYAMGGPMENHDKDISFVYMIGCQNIDAQRRKAADHNAALGLGRK